MTNVMHLASTLLTFPSCQAIFHQHQPMVSMHLSSFAMPVVAQIILTFLTRHRALLKRLLSQGYKVNRLSNTFKKFYGRQTDLVGQYKKMSAKCLLILSVEMIFYFLMDLPMAKLIKLAKMAGVMHEADHAYSIQSTW